MIVLPLTIKVLALMLMTMLIVDDDVILDDDGIAFDDDDSGLLLIMIQIILGYFSYKHICICCTGMDTSWHIYTICELAQTMM